MLAEEQGAQPRSAEAVDQRQPISIGPDAKQKAKVADRFGPGPYFLNIYIYIHLQINL